MNPLIDISDEITPDFFNNYKKGQVLGFTNDGVLTHYKIVRCNKRTGNVKIQQLKLYTQDEFNVHIVNRKKKQRAK